MQRMPFGPGRWLALTSLTLCALGTSRAGRAQEPAPPPTPAFSLGSGVEVLRRGGDLLVRSAFSAEQDVVISLGQGTNRQFDFRQTRLVPRGAELSASVFEGGVGIHYCGDDSAPWNINGTYIGANHGCSGLREVTSPGHGRGLADLGSAWKDEAGSLFYLVKIVDQDKLRFISANLGTDTLWKFNTTVAGKTLTRAEPPLTLPVTACLLAQLTPACRIARQDYRLNGTDPVPEGKPLRGRFLDLVEEYDIINPADLLQDLIAHPGQERDFIASHLRGVIRNRITYRFLPYGATLIRHEAEALQEFQLGYMGFVQNAKLNTGAFARHDYYVPRVLPFVQDGISYDFQARQDFRGKVPKQLHFGPQAKNIADPAALPDRFIQLLGTATDSDPRYQVGFAVGYSMTQGLTVPAERARNVNNALMIYTSSKSYPTAIDAKMANPIPAGTTFASVSYRQYFSADACPNATCAYWHLEGRDLIAYVDFHRPVEREVLRLPMEAAGKPLTVLDKTDSMTVLDRAVSAAGAVTLSVAGTHGYAVLRVAEVGE